MDMNEAFGIPLIMFMIFVAPIWVIMHYRSKRKISEGLSDVELNQLNDLSRRAEKMADRNKTRETTVEAESPDWRRTYG